MWLLLIENLSQYPVMTTRKTVGFTIFGGYHGGCTQIVEILINTHTCTINYDERGHTLKQGKIIILVWYLDNLNDLVCTVSGGESVAASNIKGLRTEKRTCK